MHRTMFNNLFDLVSGTTSTAPKVEGKQATLAVENAPLSNRVQRIDNYYTVYCYAILCCTPNVSKPTVNCDLKSGSSRICLKFLF